MLLCNRAIRQRAQGVGGIDEHAVDRGGTSKDMHSIANSYQIRRRCRDAVTGKRTAMIYNQLGNQLFEADTLQVLGSTYDTLYRYSDAEKAAMKTLSTIRFSHMRLAY